MRFVGLGLCWTVSLCLVGKSKVQSGVLKIKEDDKGTCLVGLIGHGGHLVKVLMKRDHVCLTKGRGLLSYSRA